MTGYHLFLVVLSFYLLFLVLTGIYFNRKQHFQVDFWLAGRSASALSIGFSAAASWLTAGGLLAVIGFYMLLGMGSVWGFVAPNILALLVISFLVSKIKSLPAITQPELLELRYGRYLRLPVAIIITVVMILFAVADIKGFAMVLQVFYGISPTYAALIVGLAVAVYVTLGGLSAVIASDVIQFVFLSVFVLVMAVVVMSGATAAADVSWGQIVTAAPEGWWNPATIGLPMILIFVLAIVPGWITEQDPWQRVWAARDETAARRGMQLGSLLVTVVFGGCALIALGLNTIYPEIAEAGFPVGMAQAEPALLTFIMGSGVSDFSLALCAVCLAAAAMSCADTFAASGASCIARDIYQHSINRDASERQMRVISRLSVLLIISCATAGSFFITSIIDAIHIATYIASASYFFVLMGGLYWRRATGPAAVASLWTGFSIQCGLVIVDLVKTVPLSPSYLESIHPALVGHGVIVSMLASGTVFCAFSLLTRPSEQHRLAPFFPHEGHRISSEPSGMRGTPGTQAAGK